MDGIPSTPEVGWDRDERDMTEGEFWRRLGALPRGGGSKAFSEPDERETLFGWWMDHRDEMFEKGLAHVEGCVRSVGLTP